MVIKGKETKNNALDPGVFPSHRFTIELDDDSEIERDDNGTLSVEDLIPTMHNLKIRSPPQSQNDNPDVTRAKEKIIEVVLRNNDARRFEGDDHNKSWGTLAEPSRMHTLLDRLTLASKPAILNEVIDTSEQRAYGISKSSAVAAQVSGSRIIESRLRSEKDSLEEKVGRNKTDAATIVTTTQPVSHEPPREPKAMREQRNREQQRIPSSKGQLQVKVDEDPTHFRPEGKENSRRFRR